MNFQLSKKLVIFSFVLLLGQARLLGQQVLITDDTLYVSEKPYALLELFSKDHNKGILLPQLTSSERMGMDVNEEGAGLLLYDTDTESFWYWDGIEWGEIARKNGEKLRIGKILDEDEDTGVYVEKVENENQIRFEVLGEEALRIDSLGNMVIKHSFRQKEGPLINEIRQDSSLGYSDTSLVTEGTIRRYLDANIPDSVVYTAAELYISVQELGVKGDGVTDDTDSLQAAINNHPGATLFFPDGVYKANIHITNPITLVSFSGNVSIKSSVQGVPVLKVSAACKLLGMKFIHLDGQPGSNGIVNEGKDIEAENCTFLGYENHITPGFSTSTFRNCTFTVVDEGLGSLAWSPDAKFFDCTFDGVVGVDVMDSKFYNCQMSGLWGVHMPEGAVDNAGNPTGYTGIGEFHACEIKGSFYYAIGLGNRAHARMYNCTIIGHTSGAYARTESTFEAYNCYIECTMQDGGSTAVKFAKYITAEKDGIGLIDTGDSYFSQCTFVNSGSESGYHLIVPDKSDAGQVYLNNCNFSLQKTCTEDTVMVCQGDIYRYVSMQAGVNETPHEIKTVSTAEALIPKFSPVGVTFLDLSGNGGPANFLRLSKNYGNNKEYPAGYRLLIRCSSSSNNITFRNGYYAPIGTGIQTLSNQDLTLNANEYATFVYTKNYWVEVSSNSSAKRKALDPTSDNAFLFLTQENIQANGKLSLEIPAGYKIASLVMESRGGAIQKIGIGTQPDLGNIFQEKKLEEGTPIEAGLKKSLFSLHQKQALYLKVNNWNQATLNIYLKLERIK
ncbi:MAG: glycosyl hydrolase family 28-related protein [Bacteroidota bacterium]